MHQQLKLLLAALRRVADGRPRDVGALLNEVPAAGALPSPWTTWTLIGLVRHRRRQLWVDEIVRTRLNGYLGKITANGILGHPTKVDQQGSVPDLPDWKYCFHRRGCRLTHKERGEAIDVDFIGDSAEDFHGYFYCEYLSSLRFPEQAEQRLRELHRWVEPIHFAYDEMLTLGALVPSKEPDSNQFRLAGEVLACEDAIDALCRAWSFSDERLWLAALIGDWPAADEVVGNQPAMKAITERHSMHSRQVRLAQLSGKIHQSADALYGLAEIDAAAPTIAIALESRSISGLLAVTLEIIVETNDRRWNAEVYKIFRSMEPRDGSSQSTIWLRALKVLLQFGYCKEEALAELPKANMHEVNEAVLLALEHAPQHVLRLVRGSLLSTVPSNRVCVAATLALLAQPWCKRELLQALGHSDDQRQTASIRAALLTWGDVECDEAVQAWEASNPHVPAERRYFEIDGERQGPFLSSLDRELNALTMQLEIALNKLRDRVMKLRHVDPPEPTQPPGVPNPVDESVGRR